MDADVSSAVKAAGSAASAKTIVDVAERSLAKRGDAVDVDQPTGADDSDAVGRMLHLVERV